MKNAALVMLASSFLTWLDILVKAWFPALGVREAYQISMLPAMRETSSLKDMPLGQ